MKPFLKIVAEDVYHNFGNEITETTIVFPNKRAGLFFNKYLEEISDRPQWSPAYTTISDLFEQNSDDIVGNNILLVSRLYKVFREKTHSDEVIDDFYYWGEMLIRDFDDIDKNLADAKKLFANLRDLEAMGSAIDTLTEEQRKAIKRFFANLDLAHKSEIKNNFVSLWEVLGDIYTQFKATLKSEGIAYEGMLYREVIENIDNIVFPQKRYLFVGFNALNSVERALFTALKRRGQALFYWDYDSSYFNDEQHEASRFLRQNLIMENRPFPREIFPNRLKEEQFFADTTKRKITFAESGTNNMQMRYIPQWLEEVKGNNIDTAIVLCDESMLETTLHTIPTDIKNINVTMGYPLSHTPAFTLVKQLIKLATEGYDAKSNAFRLAAVHNVLSHPYIIKCSPEAAKKDKSLLKDRMMYVPAEELAIDDLLANIFVHHTDNQLWVSALATNIYDIAVKCVISTKDDEKNESDVFDKLLQEALLKSYTTISTLIPLLQENELKEMKPITIGRLILRMMSADTVPFHGEPIEGMQIMGLLESRNLDFKNLIFIGANEGNLPKKSIDSSFIPYNLKRAFNLTLSEHRDSIYAYNFYRLLHRAEKITIMYNSEYNAMGGGEQSRYLLQLLAKEKNIEKIMITNRQGGKQNEIIVDAVKSNVVIEKLIKNFDANVNDSNTVLSPTGINRYLDCPLKFFYYYVLGLYSKQQEQTTIQPNDFGTIFHSAAEEFYSHLCEKYGKTVLPEHLKPYVDNPKMLEEYVDIAFKKNFFKRQSKLIFDGEQLINRNILLQFLTRLIKIDYTTTPFTYLGSEERLYIPIEVPLDNGRKITIKVGGTIDRMHIKDNTLYIVDYKTGGKVNGIKNIDAIFSGQVTNAGYYFQIMLYSIIAKRNNLATMVSPALLYIHSYDYSSYDDFVVNIENQPVVDVSVYEDEFMEKLQQTLTEIFSSECKITMVDEKKNKCEYCDYRRICNRGQQ